MTKGEIAKKMKEMEGVSATLTRSQAIYAMGIDELNSRTVGALEMTDLLGHSCFAFDIAGTWIPTDPRETRARMFNPKKTDDDTDTFLPNLVYRYYPARPKDLGAFSLYNLAVNFKVGKKTKSDPRTCQVCTAATDVQAPSYVHEYRNYDIPSYPGKQFIKVKKRVARFFLPDHDDSDALKVEDFYRRMCLLFIPWTDEEAILDTYQKETYFETFIEYMKRLESSAPSAYDEVVKLVTIYKDFRKDSHRAFQKAKQIKKTLRNQPTDPDDFLLQVQARNVDVAKHRQRLDSLNPKQKKLYELVMKGIEVSANGEKPILLYTTGTAGVGKSYVIDCIADAVELMYGSSDQTTHPAVLLAAPTGLAAISINGQTLHTLLGIEVQKGSESVYESLTDEKRDLRREMFKDVQLLIIDEISMVSAELMAKISNRLKEIMGSREDFDGLNVVVFGDLMQLPPVRARPVFEGLTPVIARRVFGGFGCGVNLWRLFQFFELTVNVRQQNDKEYADLLGSWAKQSVEFTSNTFGRMRMGEMTDADEVVLRTRLIDPTGAPADLLFAAQYHLNTMTEDPLVMTLLPRISEVTSFNEHAIERMGQERFSIDADDTQGTLYTETTTAKDNKEVPTVAAGLCSNLTLGINARVMLRRTIDRVNGLVNGLTGVLVEVKAMDGDIYQLGIRFDRTPGHIHWVPKTSAMYELSSGEVRRRRQFPVEVAFGVTCHKAQGLTLANVIMSTESMFANAQFYVSASRVTGLNGLHLINLDMAKATVDEKAKEEYRRLRALN